MVLAIGDAPTAIAEAARLIREHGWRPQLVIGLPVGFVGAAEIGEVLPRGTAWFTVTTYTRLGIESDRPEPVSKEIHFYTESAGWDVSG